MADDSTPSATASPFVRRFAENFGSRKEYNWFLDMLEGQHPRVDYNSRDTPRFPSTVRIVDKSANSSKASVFDASEDADVDPDFVKILHKQSTNTEIRQIVLSYAHIADLNFSWIETLGSALNLDPLFFITHFECSRGSYAGCFRARAPPPLPLELNYLQFHYSEKGHITLMKTPHEEFPGGIGSSVIALLEDGDKVSKCPDRPGPVFLDAISDSDSHTNKSTESFAPIDCIAPLLQATAVDIATDLKARSDYLFVSDSLTASTLTRLWKSNQRSSHILEEIVKNMELALGAAEWSDSCSAQINRLHRQCIALLQSSKLVSQNIQSTTQQMNSVESIREAQKGVQQADSVRRLSLVAFVFIPLNFATSFFGMNLQQLGTGRIHIGFFFLTAILAGGLGILLSTGIKPLERSMTRARQKIATDCGNDLEDVGKRDILRFSRVGERILEAMTVRDDDGNEIYKDKSWVFHTTFLRWCSFNVRKLWASIKSNKDNPRDDDDKP